MGTEHARHTVDAVVRDSYGRLVSFLAARSRDVAAAEDALGEALVAALRAWPRDGVPDRPEAWLLKAARYRLIDHARHDRVRADGAVTLRVELVRRAPTLGARVGRAAALGNARGAAAGLAALATIAPEPVGAYQPYWAVRAHLLAETGAGGEARQAYTRAIALSQDDAVRAFLLRRRGRVTAN